jgi:hypothetical protein
LPLHIPCDTINIEKYYGFIPLLFFVDAGGEDEIDQKQCSRFIDLHQA